MANKIDPEKLTRAVEMILSARHGCKVKVKLKENDGQKEQEEKAS